MCTRCTLMKGLKLNSCSGGDYSSLSSIITFPAGQTSQTVIVGTLDDSVAELTERFEAALSNPSMGMVLGGQSRANVDILDDEGGCLTAYVHIPPPPSRRNAKRNS